ncbi:MAG: hypothetical protein D6689_16290 [Deltaproteobacteria bacterium]|nr:MAG: hypothetical protein D6689_16290 [Deltaproteobacteria bacterium]
MPFADARQEQLLVGAGAGAAYHLSEPWHARFEQRRSAGFHVPPRAKPMSRNPLMCRFGATIVLPASITGWWHSTQLPAPSSKCFLCLPCKPVPPPAVIAWHDVQPRVTSSVHTMVPVLSRPLPWQYRLSQRAAANA